MKTNVTLEQALAKASKRLQEEMMYSIDLLKKAERLALAYCGGNGYYLAFSGGKDSQALYHIAELAGVKFDAHMNFTSVDPKTLKPFDRVLVRDSCSHYWRCSLFSHIETDRHLFPYATSGGNYSYCIPYNDDTACLVGTKDEPSDYYRYWDDLIKQEIV